MNDQLMNKEQGDKELQRTSVNRCCRNWPDCPHARQLTAWQNETAPKKTIYAYLGTVLSFLMLTCSALAGSIRFDWDANSEPNISGYHVYLGPTSRVYTVTIPVTSNSYTLTNVQVGRFYAAITAINDIGMEGPYSVELTIDPLIGVYVQGQTLYVRAAHSLAGLKTNFTVIAQGPLAADGKTLFLDALIQPSDFPEPNPVRPLSASSANGITPASIKPVLRKTSGSRKGKLI